MKNKKVTEKEFNRVKKDAEKVFERIKESIDKAPTITTMNLTEVDMEYGRVVEIVENIQNKLEEMEKRLKKIEETCLETKNSLG